MIVGQYRRDPVLAAKCRDLRVENHVSSGAGFADDATEAVQEPRFREGDLAGRRCPQLVNEAQCLVCRGWWIEDPRVRHDPEELGDAKDR